MSLPDFDLDEALRSAGLLLVDELAHANPRIPAFLPLRTSKSFSM